MTDQMTDQIPESGPAENQPVKLIQISAQQQNLIKQIKASREIFDQAHALALKAQEAFELVKNEIHQIQLSAEEEVIAIKAQADIQINQILQEIETCKRDLSNQISDLRQKISQIRMPEGPAPITERVPDQD